MVVAVLAAFGLAYTMAPTQALAAGETGSVSGTITGEDTHQPLAGVYVYLWSSDENNSTSRWTSSGPEGTFAFDGLPDGTYHLYGTPASGAGEDTDYYLSTYRSVSGSTIDYSASASITVSGSAITGQDIALVAGAVVSGSLTGGGSPVSVQNGWPEIQAFQQQAGSWQSSGWGLFDSGASTYHLVTPVGSTRLSFAADGFRTEYYDNSLTAAGATAVELAAGDHRTINVDLAPGPKISGVVYAGLTPVPYAQVCAHPVDDYYAYKCANASATGSYSIGLDLDPAASYVLEATTDGYLTTYYATGGSVATRSGASAVSFGGGFDQSGKDVHLIAGATVSGTVSRAIVGPVSGAYVCDDSGQYNCASTESDGTFSLRVAPGTVTLHATYDPGDAEDYFIFTGDSAPLSVTDGESYSNTNIVLSEGTGLGGTVTRDLPVGVEVSVYRVIGTREVWVDGRWLLGDQSAFAFRDLAAGTYVVRFRADGFADACLGGATCTQVEVTNGTFSGASETELTRLAPGSVSGTVVDSAGNPISGVSVEASYDGMTSSQVTTGENGAFSFDSLPAGITWELSFTKDGLAGDTHSVTPRPGQNTALPKVHLLGTGTVSGTLTVPADGDPTAVAIYLEGPAYYSAQVDDQGNYSFTGVVPGRYHVRAESSDDQILSAWYPGVMVAEDAPRVVVSEGGTVVLDPLALGTPAAISGSLLDGDGNPVQGNVRLYDASDSEVSRGYVSGSGQYSFSDLWPGRYTIRATASSDAFKNTWLGNTTSIDTAERITLTEGEASSDHAITMIGRAGGPVTGRVIAHDGTTGVSGLEVSANGYDASTGADGSFSMAFVPKGSHPVTLYSEQAELCGPELALKCAPSSLTVGDDGASDVTFTLPELGSVTGHLVGPAGAAISGAEVWLVDASGSEIAWPDVSSDDFSFASVPYGSYSLVATADGLARSSVAVTVDGAVTQDLTLGVQHTISGTVTSDAPVEWMNVELIEPATGDLVDMVEFGPLDSGAVTYTFDNVNDGEQYWVRATADRGREVWYSDADTPRLASTVATSGADQIGIDLTLAAPADWHTISGKVTVPDGVAITDRFEVCVDTADHDDGSGYGDCTTPAVDGSYAMTVPDDVYSATASAPAPLDLIPAKKAIEITDDSTVDFDLTAGGSVSGRLVDSHGVGVEGEVTVISGASRSWADTDAFGFWTVNAVPAGGFSVTASADGFADYSSATPLTVVAGQDTDAGTQELTATGSLRIELAGIAGLSRTKVDAIVTDDSGTELARKVIWTGDDDTITGIPAGLVKVRFEGAKVVTEWWKNAPDADRAVAIAVANDTTTTISASLAAVDPVPPAAISGVITNNTGRSGVIRLTAIDQDEQNTVVVVNDDGSYSLSLAPGTYQFRASVCDGLWMGESGCLGKTVTAWYKGTSIDNAERVTVESGSSRSDIDLTIKGAVRTFTIGTPTISGTAKVGQTLSASAGTWTPASGVSYTYRWFRGGDTLSNAATYTLKSSDLGKTVSVEVTAKKTGYIDATSDPVTSATVSRGTLATAKPRIEGTPTAGATLSARPGNWTDGTTFTYQWKRDDAVISSATGSTYKVPAGDGNHTIKVMVTGSKDGYESASTTSDGVTIQKLKVGTGSVSLQASSWNVGIAVTAVPSGWPAGASLSFQWKRNGAPIAGATGRTYTLQTADQGARVSVVVTAAIAGQESASAESSASGAVQPRLKKLTKGKVSISGTAKVGKKLTAKVSKWKPSGIKYRYQWLRDGVAIAGATKSSYKIAKSAKNSKISVRVIATKSGYASITVTSKTTAKVK